MRSRTNGGSVDSRSGQRQATTSVATEVVLLWPRGVGPAATVAEAGLWPVFVLVIGEPPVDERSSAAPLFEMLDRPKSGAELKVVAGRCHWSVLDARNALLKVALEAEAPERFAVEIVVPARAVLGILDVVAQGATVGVTTDRHAAKLTGRLDIRRALPEVVLFSCEPSVELAAIANVLHRALSHG